MNRSHDLPVEQSTPPISSMKIRHKATEGESRELLLKEYFLNAYLIAMLKQVSNGVRLQSEEANAEFAQRVVEQN